MAQVVGVPVAVSTGGVVGAAVGTPGVGVSVPHDTRYEPVPPPPAVRPGPMHEGVFVRVGDAVAVVLAVVVALAVADEVAAGVAVRVAVAVPVVQASP